MATRLKYSGIKTASAAPGLAATNLQTTTQQHSGMQFVQSAKDGTMPLLTACNVENGDFYEPQNGMGMYGPPVKKEFEKECKNEESRKMLLEKSE